MNYWCVHKCIVFCCILCYVVCVVFPQFFYFRCLYLHILVLSITYILFITLWNNWQNCSNIIEKVHGNIYWSISRLHVLNYGTGTKHLFPWNVVCAKSDRCALLGSRLGFRIHHTTDMVGGVSLQIEDAPVHACHFVFCKGGLVVGVASVAVVVMAMGGFLSPCLIMRWTSTN